MSHDRRLGIVGIIVGLFAIAAFYLWPNQTYIGWTSLILAGVILFVWMVAEIRARWDRLDPELSIEESLRNTIPPKTLPDPEEGGPEIVMDYRKPAHAAEDGHLVLKHVGGGSARNIVVGEIKGQHWKVTSDPISYLREGSLIDVRTELAPWTEVAIREHSHGSGYMTLDAFVASPLDVGPILITVMHEDGTSRLKVETVFEMTYDERFHTPRFFQKARHVTRLF